MQRGGWTNANNPSSPNGINVEADASASTIAVEDGQTTGMFLNEINSESSAGTKKKESSLGANITNNQQVGGDNRDNPSTPNVTGHNGRSNISTGASARTIAEEDGQTP